MARWRWEWLPSHGLALRAHHIDGVVATELPDSKRYIYAATYGEPPAPVGRLPRFWRRLPRRRWSRLPPEPPTGRTAAPCESVGVWVAVTARLGRAGRGCRQLHGEPLPVVGTNAGASLSTIQSAINSSKPGTYHTSVNGHQVSASTNMSDVGKTLEPPVK